MIPMRFMIRQAANEDSSISSCPQERRIEIRERQKRK
jgi:hypothetical protein